METMPLEHMARTLGRCVSADSPSVSHTPLSTRTAVKCLQSERIPFLALLSHCQGQLSRCFRPALHPAASSCTNVVFALYIPKHICGFPKLSVQLSVPQKPLPFGYVYHRQQFFTLFYRHSDFLSLSLSACAFLYNFKY